MELEFKRREKRNRMWICIKHAQRFLLPTEKRYVNGDQETRFLALRKKFVRRRRDQFA